VYTASLRDARHTQTDLGVLRKTPGQVVTPQNRGLCKLSLQIIISRNKEEVLSEKTMKAHFGATIVTGFSDVSGQVLLMLSAQAASL